MNWKGQAVHVLDFEGTRRTGVIEYGVVTLREGLLESTSTGLCRSREDIQPEDINVHGIDQAMIAVEVAFENQWNLFSQLRATGLLVAHHASVEGNLLKETWPYPRLTKNLKQLSWGPWIDTRRIYERLYKGLETYRLSSLIDRFALRKRLAKLSQLYCPPQRRKTHCALYDALASALLLMRLDEISDLNEATVEWLLEISVSNRKQRDDLRQGDFFLG
jgi:DNA polymerase-3 subunit epsilon